FWGIPASSIWLESLLQGGPLFRGQANARQFVNEDHVDAIVGSSSVLTTAPIFSIAAESQTVQLPLAPITIPESAQKWVFNIAQPLDIMVGGVVTDMVDQGFDKIAYIGFADGWGDQNLDALTAQAKAHGLDIVASERYSRTDASATAQAINIVSSGADAVYVGGAGTASVLPHRALRDMGFQGPIYHSHGAVAETFIQTGGSVVEGAVMPTSPMVVADELPDDHPSKAPALNFIKAFQAEWGDETVQPFAGYAWDAVLLLDSAVATASETAKPGTPEFRAALRDALEAGGEVAGVSAVYEYGEDDHYGVDERARVLVEVRDGAFSLR
ncbi:ABC transporter substrate-binding protein, partial [Amorphus sp. 3PC139-8]|uniref:ABC transporter substrate-binding protein n=1 Tax=Amorphus sp. 3PC139-8 TaxID=2735676 RepID=UPI00345C99B9